MKKNNAIVFGIFLVSICGLIFFGWRTLNAASSSSTDEQVVRLVEGQKFPSLTLTSRDGKEVQTTELSDGKMMVVMEWASWCPDCQQQLPIIQELYEQYGDRVTFVLMNLSDDRDPQEQVDNYIKEKGYTFPYYYDKDGQVKEKLGITSIPTTFLVDKTGNLLKTFDLVTPKEEFVKALGLD